MFKIPLLLQDLLANSVVVMGSHITYHTQWLSHEIRFITPTALSFLWSAWQERCLDHKARLP